MSEAKLIPIRCCCHPVKILGYLPYFPGLKRMSVETKSGEVVEIEAKRYQNIHGVNQQAWYGDDHPVDWWMEIIGYVMP